MIAGTVITRKIRKMEHIDVMAKDEQNIVRDATKQDT
jgi:hypothetical protein